MTAVGLVALGILGLQALVPDANERDSPAVVRSPAAGEPPVFSITATPEPAPTSAPTAVSPAPTSAAPSPVTRPALTVLNNSRVDNLAARAARDFADGGWRVAATGNLRGRTPRTTVYYDPGQEAAAAALRRQFPRILAAAPRPPGLPGGGTLTVVVTRDYAA